MQDAGAGGAGRGVLFASKPRQRQTRRLTGVSSGRDGRLLKPLPLCSTGKQNKRPKRLKSCTLKTRLTTPATWMNSTVDEPGAEDQLGRGCTGDSECLSARELGLGGIVIPSDI